MAIIKPFQAYRPAPGLEQQIAALPYDVYNRQEATEIVKENPGSFLAIDRAETAFQADVDTYDEKVYAKANELLQSWIAEGRFIQEDKPCYYLYEQTFQGRKQTGIVACASIDEYQQNIIKKHENTRADKEADRIHHVDTCSMQTGPIFLAYRAQETLSALIGAEKENHAPIYDFISEDGIGHKVWLIAEDKQIQQITEAFQEIPALYIADGHHRCASAVKVGVKRREQYPDFTGTEEFNSFLSVIFADSELAIMDYNRVVKDLNGLSKDEFLTKIQDAFLLKESSGQVAPAAKGCFGMYLDGQWYELQAKPEICSEDAVAGLDVSILQDYLLEPILGIQDPKTDKRIDFVGGIRGLQELEKRVHTDMQVAFSMHPTSMAELLAVADAKRLMPPKSTWFEPKLRSGLFLHEIER
ncbi:MAG: DUF1015 domain-containing protein [Lachnospiraceae bacterium]|nr:DUF1015 domain-containing protein [Lachnospiraceae bacterium]